MTPTSTRTPALDHPGPTLGRPRVVGAAALALASSLVAQNVVVVVTGSPDYASPMAEVLAFHAEHRGAVAVAVGLEALNLPLLLGLLVGLHALVARRGRGGTDWSRLAIAAGGVLASVLVLYAVLWNGVVLAADGLTEPSPQLELVWRLHAAAFAFVLPALGTTLAASALAAHASGLTPSWLRPLGLLGGALALAAGTASLAIADGSPLLFVGMPGYAVFMVWLLAAGVVLVRTTER